MVDAIVRRAMRKWPKVPAVYGWLALDRRGRWLIQGQPLAHRPTIDFINRNYQADEAGCWYFQNGPQRVFVELTHTPWIYALDSEGALCAHTGARVGELRGALVDEHGDLVIETELGPGLLDDRDLGSLGDALFDRQGRLLDEDALLRLTASAAEGVSDSGVMLRFQGTELRVRVLASAEFARHFGYVPDPRPI